MIIVIISYFQFNCKSNIIWQLYITIKTIKQHYIRNIIKSSSTRNMYVISFLLPLWLRVRRPQSWMPATPNYFASWTIVLLCGAPNYNESHWCNALVALLARCCATCFVWRGSPCVFLNYVSPMVGILIRLQWTTHARVPCCQSASPTAMSTTSAYAETCVHL